MPDPLQDLCRIAAELAPRDTLLVAPAGHPLTEALGETGPFEQLDASELLLQPDAPARRRLVLVAGALEHLPAQRGEQLLALLRDRVAETLYCLADAGQWPAHRMLALGLRPLGTYPRGSRGTALYHFDLFDYKRTPDWLTPRHWANPELWDRYRW